MDDAEAEYVIKAVDLVGSYGFLFLSATWLHKEYKGLEETFSLNVALGYSWEDSNPLSSDIRIRLYDRYLNEAAVLSEKFKRKAPKSTIVMEGELGKLQFFSLLSDRTSRG
jgi:hypothetical protein